jgi:hypothetical protein
MRSKPATIASRFTFRLQLLIFGEPFQDSEAAVTGDVTVRTEAWFCDEWEV